MKNDVKLEILKTLNQRLKDVKIRIAESQQEIRDIEAVKFTLEHR